MTPESATVAPNVVSHVGSVEPEDPLVVAMYLRPFLTVGNTTDASRCRSAVPVGIIDVGLVAEYVKVSAVAAVTTALFTFAGWVDGAAPASPVIVITSPTPKPWLALVTVTAVDEFETANPDAGMSILR